MFLLPLVKDQSLQRQYHRMVEPAVNNDFALLLIVTAARASRQNKGTLQ